MYPTHLIYSGLSRPEPIIKPETYQGHCAFCGAIIVEGVLLEKTVSSSFTNFDMLSDMNASHVCVPCHVCLKETKLRRYNFIATKSEVKYFKRDELESLLFNPPQPPFVFCVTINFKKHMSFKAKVNFSQKLYSIQKEDEHILFSPAKYKNVFAAMKRLYTVFPKSAIENGVYQQNFIMKYGLTEFVRDEGIIKKDRGTQQFELLLISMNMSEESLKKMKERIAKKEAKGK